MSEEISTGEIAEAAVQSENDVTTSVGQVEDAQQVPLSALQAERQQRQQLQENLKVMQDHMALLQANNEAPKKESETFDGLTDNDVLTVGEAKKFMKSFSKDQTLALEELKMSQQHSDYNEVVRNFLPEVLKNDPDLKDMIVNAPNPYKAAYYVAKRSDGYLKKKRHSSRSPEAREAVENLQRPGNLSSVGTGVSGSASKSYKSMSDGDFRKLINKNLGHC